MADQEITVADALAYAATRRVFKDTNSRVLVVLADALVAVEDERDALVARVARADALSDVKEDKALHRLGYRKQEPVSESLLIEVRLGSEYEPPNAEGSEPGGWFAYVESATVLAGNLSEGVRSLAAPHAGELDYDGFVQEAIATYIASVPVEEDPE